jgi:imidazolonepropionase-like amidohydrolase
MKHMRLPILLALAIGVFVSTAPSQTVAIRAGRLIDGNNDKPFEGVTILVEKNKIINIGKEVSIPAHATVIDLGDRTVLPGFIDAHTHIMYVGADDYGAELYKKSIPFRTLCAADSARKALLRGFTALRDVESEGTMYADVDLKKAIDQGIVCNKVNVYQKAIFSDRIPL